MSIGSSMAASTLEWREDVPDNLVELAVGRCMVEVMDDKWSELGLLTGTTERIQNHSRLLRSLRFNDEDYAGHVFDMVPVILGKKAPERQQLWGPPVTQTPTGGLHERLPNLRLVTDFLDLPAWLALNHPGLLERLFVDRTGPTMPDGEVLSAAEAAAARLEVAEMRRQVDRIRRDLADDPEAAVGQAKDLIETTCKTILGMHGTTGEKLQLPKLVKQTLLHLGVDPTQLVAAGEDTMEAHAAQMLMGGVSRVLLGADELRNARGTGHGRSGGPEVDAALARLAVGTVLPAVLYLVELYEQRAEPDSVATFPLPPSTATPQLQEDAVVRHASFGEGVVRLVTGEGNNVVVAVDFGGQVGIKQLLVRYASLEIVR